MAGSHNFTPVKSPLARILLAAATALGAIADDSPIPKGFEVRADRFADVQVLRYHVPGFETLPLPQKKLAYYLTQAGLSGRDIYYDQKYRHNLAVRKTLEGILETYTGDRSGAEWSKFTDYARQIFFANGVHHHYASTKILAEFLPTYLGQLLAKSAPQSLPLKGRSLEDFQSFLQPIFFDPKVDAKCVDLSPGIDNVTASAGNFYQGVTQKEVEAYYDEVRLAAANPRLSFGLNTTVVKVGGKVTELPWKIDGKYSDAISQIVYWLEKAVLVAENDAQRDSLEKLIAFYRTGNLTQFDNHCIAWVKDKDSRIDVVNGFIEVYQDPLQKKGGFESVVSMRDEVASKRIATISSQAQWFEDHSPILDSHKKKNVVGVSAKVITVIGEVGDTAPATPIGINLPNAEWIREQYGSKSVTIGNIMASYNEVQARSPAVNEFGHSPEMIARVKKWGALAATLHVDMHEVIGHASGQINPGVANPDKTLKGYAGTLEEARADLVALYYIMDPKLVELGLMESLEVGKAEYDTYINNGLMTQLFRIKPGNNLEEAHMRNRQLNSAWVFEQGKKEQVIERLTRDGKTYFRINDYARLRVLFGKLLREIQRIKSEGDFAAASALVEGFGVRVDQALLKEVHQRYAPLNVAPYMGFIQPRLVPVEVGGEITDVKIEYPTDFLAQMLEYGRTMSFLK